jgi:hypothetical protein
MTELVHSVAGEALPLPWLEAWINRLFAHYEPCVATSLIRHIGLSVAPFDVVSLGELADRFGCSVDDVHDAIVELCAAGLIDAAAPFDDDLVLVAARRLPSEPYGLPLN